MFKNITLPVALLMSLMSVAVNAEVRIGYVHTKKVVEQAPQAAAASNKLQTEFAAREASIVAEQKKLKQMEEQLQRDSAIMSEEARRKLERDILSMQRDIKRSREEFTQDLNIRRNEEFAKLQRDVRAAIESIAKEEKFDLIFESGVVYVSSRIDLTAKVIERLKQQLSSGEQKK